MEDKDWNARFEVARPAYFVRAIVRALAIVLLAVCTLWAIVSFNMGFHDSMGNPRNSDLPGHVRVYTISLAPFILPAFVIYWDWTLRTKNRRRQ